MLLTPETACGTYSCATPIANPFVEPERPTAAARNRNELNAVIRIFIEPGAIKELNIPPTMRDEALRSLQTSSEPKHLAPIADHVYLLLRNCSHRNFVRLGVSNGTFETLCATTSLGIVVTFAGFLLMFLQMFYPAIGAHSRWEALAIWPLWFVGLTLVLAGLRGSCFFLLLFLRRQALPWEHFDDDARASRQRSALGTSALGKLCSRLMIFDRKIRVQDVHLRRLQIEIVVQSLIGGTLCATLGVSMFIFLPVWKETAPK